MDKLQEIFSIERRFRWSKYRLSRFKETCARGPQSIKTIADRHGHAAYDNKH